MKTLALALFAVVIGIHAEQFAELNPQRIETIESFLSETPATFGQPITNRAYWSDPKILARVNFAIPVAEKLLGKTFPAWSDDLYLEFSKNGKRSGGERMENARGAWLTPLVLAECIENKGRFLPAISTVLQGYVDEPTWTLAAHDAKLESFSRKHYSVDLRAATFGHDIATAINLLDGKLDPALRKRVVDALYERCLKPVRQSFVSGRGHFWLTADHNWNSVCLAGVVGIALAIEPDRRERAIFVAAGEHYSRHFLKGFKNDGYCTEGGSYWSYGFGNYAVLREELVQSTKGKIDLFSDPKVVAIALYGERFQLNDHVMPGFADCHYNARANTSLLAYCNQALNLKLSGLEAIPAPGRNNLGAVLIMPTCCESAVSGQQMEMGDYSYFADSGVLVCRPSAPDGKMAVAIKAGGNGNHSHDDVGSYVIQLGKDFEIGEPGGPFVYSRRTFGPKRYECQLINSYGHPVPVVAGMLQSRATSVKPVVLSTHFSKDVDEISIDMTPAYKHARELVKLVRTLRYDRQGPGSVTIKDEVEFSTPSSFETVLTSRVKYSQQSTNQLRFVQGTDHLTATIKASENYTLSDETISEMSTPSYKRIDLKLSKPVSKATVEITIK